ncbi:phospholipase A [Litchfieldella rifensis]|uniref:Phospholipase A1 n=1 Tax=Litchfieldella rifensis TaxID=762643 RepID=A0ABV7LM88_9GAMM
MAIDSTDQDDLTPAEREAIEARIEALTTELEDLRDQLAQADEEAPSNAVLEEAEERRELERESSLNPFAITAYRRNYLMPWSYNANPNGEDFREISGDDVADNAEVKFQFSAKFSLVEDMFGDNGDLFFAYTQRSWWQAYNSDNSAPFRETNFEPEVFVSFDNDLTLFGWTNTQNRIAFNHQSNGKSGELSRSWNRIYAETIFQRGDWAVSVAPHWRVPESEGDDDNPDIERFMGYGDISIARRINDDHEASLLVRGNPSAGNMGTQLDYSWPMFGNVRGYVQYYYGYGESLIDYDHRNNRLSLGFSLNPLFSGSQAQR